ncbi:MAG TPA: 6,7-dimethyl-8-ribityllumazine synthase [Ignavibacteriales bacterium]|nr:6,7-dimethyl-8-ribityllumazine synthase [Ignavibacteriales bacterium]
MNLIEGKISASNYKFAIVQSRDNEFIGDKLLEAALDCLRRHNCEERNITVVKVPGAFEISVTADKLATQKRFDAIICLGAVIRGATPHFEYISSAVSNGISQTALKHGVPVIYGVLTTDTVEQAIERSGTKSGNKGWDAALTAIEMADLFQKL